MLKHGSHNHCVFMHIKSSMHAWQEPSPGAAAAGAGANSITKQRLIFACSRTQKLCISKQHVDRVYIVIPFDTVLRCYY